jgi:hypothetical protein
LSNLVCELWNASASRIRSSAPGRDDQAVEPDRLIVGAGGVHHGNDLLDRRRVAG